MEYVINPTNDDLLTESDIALAITTAAEVWDSASGSELFLDYSLITFDYSAEIDTDVPDTKNEIVFGSISDSNTIAMCVVWGRFLGPPSGRVFTWGDAKEDSTVMDLQNIVTHELGHALGLADLYDTTAPVPEQTMYGYASTGETKKRSLEAGDKAGITVLYG